MLKRFFINLSSRARIGSLVLTMALLYGADRFLAALEQRELVAEARDYAESGKADTKQKRWNKAIQDFQRAHDTERDNREYTLQLANAFLQAGQLDRAQELSDELLDDDSNDGGSNLLRARVALARGQVESADAYFHRAIYGSWSSDEKRQVLEARLELIHSLAARRDNPSLLAELIPLEQTAGEDPEIERQIPALFLQAGSVNHAEAAYRELIRKDRTNAAAYAGLGRVEMEKGNFHIAHQQFSEAVRLAPDDAQLAEEASAANKALDLDPTPRRLPSAEKFVRSNAILSLVVTTLSGCSSLTNPASLATASQLLAEKQPTSGINEAAEARLDLAAELWQKRLRNCQIPPHTADLIESLVRKISQ